MPVPAYVKDKTVLVTGAAGTIGSALCARLAPHAKAVRAFDHAESELFFLHQRLHGRGHVAPQLGDIRDLDRLRFAMSGVDVVFHTAALKHVGLGEYNPFEVVQSNLVGLDNVLRAALDANVERVIFTSSDKAVNPTNVMGASKMMGERLVTAANQIRGPRRTRFASVRFGNVIGSRGSVLPIFASQLLGQEPLTLTDDAMTRYVMTIEEAAELVLQAGARMKGGEVFVTKMRALRIADLAHAMAELLAGGRCEIVRTGARTGEKLYEELLSADERPRALELDALLVILPPPDTRYVDRPELSDFPDGRPVDREWHSGNDRLMTRDDIVAYLRETRVLDPFAPRS
ncbi:UDP-N-acetylglucosamine 4,6-dehydratase [Sandaracinus amylolyticus]|uniref:UDP-N-acetylglucosamine 4,6-dehydratase n=1 Tax=Sandaracinus amylolyticus TaxID=927083 RepID=A0A0F6SFI2_9BACT|nr:UDP-N-acetylglucosamine 4,6-dehydratase [Sandaracinus amylolyticus]